MSSPDHSLAQSSHRNATDRNTNSLPSLKTLTNKTEPISYNPTSRSSTNQYSNQFGLTSSDSSPSSSSAHTPRSNTSGSNARYGHHQNFSTSSSTSFTSTSNKPDKIIFQSSPTTLLSKNMSSHSQNEKTAPSTAMNGRKRKSSQEAIGFSRSPSSGLQHNRGGSNVTLSDGERSSPAVNNGTLVRSASDSQQGKSNHSKSNSLSAQQQQSTKRIKTARACDSCRRKKIRCDVIDDGGPILGDPNNGNGGLTCAHCRQYGFECTFFLPITETRFKKKREREAEEIAAAAAAAAAGRSHLGVGVGNGGAGGGGILPPLMHHPSRAMPLSAMPFGDPSFVPSGHPIAMPIRSTSNPSIPFNNKLKLDGPPVRISSTQEWPKPDSQGNSPSVRGNSRNHHQISRDTSLSSMRWGQQTQQSTIKSRQSSADDTPPPPDTRVLGPTSLAYIVHSTAFVPGAAIEEHDLKHHQTFEVGASGDGIIKFHKPPRGAITEADESDDLAEDLVRVPESLRGRLAGDVAEKLVNTYFEKLGFLFPVVTKSEFLHMSPPPPLMLYGICGITALSREVPKEVLSAIKATLHSMFRNVDIMSNSNINNVKSLLIMSLHSDIHGSTAVQSGSRYWNRVGAAVRMAQDLGLHRDASKRDDLDDDAFFLEQKRRVWGCCVTADRIVSITCGHPLTIDLTDCDVRLPSPHEILRYPTDLPAVPGVDKPFAFNTEMLKLSILFGRVMKTIYSPTGLMKTTDEEIMGLLNDIDRWKENLPVALQFRGAKESPAPAGILHVSFSCLLHLFFRVFMRISYNCPQHLTFSLTIERMTTVIKNTREAIAWVDLNDFYLDTIQLVSYGLVFCTTVQYHAWIRRGDQEAMASIQKAHDCVMRFERQGEHDSNQDLSMRAKTAGVINLLHKSAIGTYKNTPNSGNLNPTAGVSNRRWMDTVRGIVFKPDQSKPGGGVYIATNHNLMLDDVPPGTMILQETEAGAVPALVRTNTDNKGSVWRAVGNMATVMSGDSNNSQMSNQHSMNASGPGNNGDITRDFTHVAGGVWADAQGRPVDSQGSRLLTMIPVPGGEAIIQSYPGGPRLSFSSIAGGIAPPTGMNGNATGSTGENSTTTNSSIAFTDPAWLSALAAQAAAQSSNGNQNNNNNNVNQESQTNQSNGETLPPTFNFSDLYTFDGQIAQPAAMLPPDQAEQARTGILNVSQTSQAPSIYTFGNASGENFSNINNVTQSDVTTSNGGISNSQSHSVDPLSLDGMPGGLDFAAWEQWFRGTNTANVGTDGNQNNNNNSNSRTN